MPYSPDRFLGAQRALIENAQSIARRGMEGAGQMAELNMQAARALFSVGADGMGGLRTFSSAGVDRAAATAQADSAALASYGVRALEILANTNAEIGRLLQQQAMEMQLLLKEALSATTGPAGDGGMGLPGMMGMPFAPMARSVAPSSEKAAEQAADTIARAADAAVQTGRKALRSED